MLTGELSFWDLIAFTATFIVTVAQYLPVPAGVLERIPELK